jgi:hypothetical protein
MWVDRTTTRRAHAGGCALLALLLGACGGQARSVDDARPPSSASGAANGAETGAGGAGVAGKAGSNGGNNAGTAGTVGTAGTAETVNAAGTHSQSQGGGGTGALRAARPCDAPAPRPGGGGYSLCADGSLRRPSAAACESALPRTTPDLPLVSDECTNDSDCTSKPHGFCAYGACKYGCVVDDDCAGDAACFCGPDIGVCIPAGCRSNADCPSDFPCTAFQAPGFATPDALSCQSPADDCVTDAQCNSLNPRVSCKVQDDHRICYQDTVG